MGVERAVTLWYVHRQFLLEEIALLEAQLSQSVALTPAAVQDATATKQEEVTTLTLQLARTRAKLQTLGPCPRPLMG